MQLFWVGDMEDLKARRGNALSGICHQQSLKPVEKLGAATKLSGWPPSPNSRLSQDPKWAQIKGTIKSSMKTWPFSPESHQARFWSGYGFQCCSCENTTVNIKTLHLLVLYQVRAIQYSHIYKSVYCTS